MSNFLGTIWWSGLMFVAGAVIGTRLRAMWAFPAVPSDPLLKKQTPPFKSESFFCYLKTGKTPRVFFS